MAHSVSGSVAVRSASTTLARVLAGIAALMLAVLLTSASPARAAGLAADVAAAPEKGFGRIVLTFKDRTLLPQYVAKVSNGVLVLQFADAVEATVDRIPTDLASYVMVARRDPDGQAIRLALQRQVRVNTMEAGERLFIDLLPPTWKGAPPGLPDNVVQELAKRAEAAMKAAREADSMRFGARVLPKVEFKVGRLPTFSRFSFSWNVPYDTQMSRDGDQVRITFNRAAQIDFSPIHVDPPPGLKEIQADISGDSLSVVLTVAPEADVRGFREDQAYVVDLSMPGAAQPQSVIPAEATADATQMKGKEKVSLPGAREAQTPPAPPAPAAQIAVKSTNAPLPDEAPAPAAKEAAPAKPAAKDAAPVAAEDVPSDEEFASGNGELPPEVRENGPGDQKIVRAEAKRIGAMVRVAFPFREKVATAAFKRQDTLFVVFDSNLPIEVKAVKAVLGAMARDVQVSKLANGQVLRIVLADPQLTTLGNDGNSWVLSIGELVLEPARPLKLTRFLKPGGRGSIRVDLAEPGQVHEVPDPIVGDTLTVVTAGGPARGLMKPFSFAELDALPTAHGLAVAARVDDLKVTLDPTGVVVTREDGLSLSAGSAQSGELVIPKSERKTRRINLEGNAFITHDPAEFSEKQHELMEALVSAPDPQRTAARVQLAQFYLAHRFAPEAMGVLRRASDEEPGIQRDPGFIVLYAAAQTLTGRVEAGFKALARGEVTESADAAFWRTIAANQLGKWDEARAASSKASGAVGGYPLDIQALYYIAAAQSAIELNDFSKAQTYLAMIEPTEISQDLVGSYEILQGRVADAAGRPDDALQRYNRAAATGSRPAAAEAEYRRVRQLVRDNKMDREEAIKRLQSLAFSWRGDGIELRTLRFVANLQAEGGHWRDAFTSMRSAIMVGPEAESTRLLQDEMGREFTSLYLDGKADALDPIEALTLYYDFRDLTPPGRLGDEIVRKLADRLVSVDLLDQAAELLTHQVDNRLKGMARAQIAADLAVVYLLDRKPDKALAVLNKTRQSGLSASVERQRRIVEARALADAGRTELALELAQPLTGTDADRVRADILWRAKRWKDAGERIESMLGGRWSDQMPLDDQERQDVLRGAISFALANDQPSLDRLRAKFYPKMAQGPSAKVFDVVTQPIQAMGADFRDAARKMSAVDSLRGFVDEYRNQYLKTKPDAGQDPAKAAPKPQAAAAAPNGPKVAMNDAPAAKPAPAAK